MDFCISCGISDFTHISEFHCGFLDFSMDFCILPWISGFQRGFENFSPRFSPQSTENSTVCSFVRGVCSIRPLSFSGSMLNSSSVLLMSFKLLLVYFRLDYALDYFEAIQFQQLYHVPRVPGPCHQFGSWSGFKR